MLRLVGRRSASGDDRGGVDGPLDVHLLIGVSTQVAVPRPHRLAVLFLILLIRHLKLFLRILVRGGSRQIVPVDYVHRDGGRRRSCGRGLGRLFQG